MLIVMIATVTLLVGMLIGIEWTERTIREQMRKRYEQLTANQQQQQAIPSSPFISAVQKQKRKKQEDTIRKQSILRITK